MVACRAQFLGLLGSASSLLVAMSTMSAISIRLAISIGKARENVYHQLINEQIHGQCLLLSLPSEFSNLSDCVSECRLPTNGRHSLADTHWPTHTKTKTIAYFQRARICSIGFELCQDLDTCYRCKKGESSLPRPPTTTTSVSLFSISPFEAQLTI